VQEVKAAVGERDLIAGVAPELHAPLEVFTS
jgi:hypothetical protein